MSLTPVMDKCLKELSSMKTGGNAKRAYFPEDSKELCEIIKSFAENGEKYLVFGNMSNLLVPDEGFEIPVVITTGMKGTKVVFETDEIITVYAEGGVSVTKLSYDMCKEGLSGLEFAYGIPGTVGGAVYMNAGAYGGEIKNVVTKVYAVDLMGNEKEFLCDECGFDYRKSVFMNGGFVISGAEFTLKKSDKEKCLFEAKELMDKRIDKQPLEYPSCGSTFKRPEGLFAGKLIEDSSLKGFGLGGAYVSEKHAGFVINKDNATTDDVIKLMKYIREKVKENFDVTLEPEIKLYNNMGDNVEL